MVIGTYISIITLNENGLNAPIERHRMADRYKNQTHIYAAYKRHRLKVRGQKKVFHANGNEKKAEVTILISDKTELKDCNKTERTLCDDQGNNPRKYNNCKCICT